MSEEGTYLIRSTTNLYGSIEATNEVEDGKVCQHKDLYEQSQFIVEWAKSTREEINLDPKGVEYLPILLYALFEITKRQEHRGKTRDRVNRSRENTKSRLKLENVIVGYLDGGLEFFPSLLDTQQDGGLREGGGVHERLEAAERVSNVDQERPLGEVEDVLWRSWNFRGKTITCIDLLLPPYTVSPSPFLSHPLLVYSLSHTWNHGPHIVDPEVGLTRFQRTRKKLQRYITPKRAHTLNLISYLFLVLLTLILALRPGRWLHPWKKQKKGPGTMETVYITWALSTWFNAFPNLSRTILLIPTACAPLMAYLDSESAFSILAFSIFPTILLLILPHSPSLVFTSREIIPLSTLLQHIIGKSLRTFGLVLPLVLILFAIFVYSLNGDIFRGFFHLGVSGEIPEKGIAPFETRLWLFVTFSFLFLLSLALATVRILTPIHPSANDSWEREYGPLVALYAREKWTRAVRDGIVSRDIISPLNWIADSILPLDEVLFVYRFFPEKWKTRKIKYWMVKVTYCRDTIWIFVMGSLSFPLYIIDRLIGCV